MKKRISQRDIAQALGVNVSSVSRALKGIDGVSPALRDQIVRYAQEHGYRPNPFAMSLRYDSTQTIGIVVPDMSFSYYAHIVKVIEAEARKAGYMSVITDSGDRYAGEVECVEQLERMHVAGIILCPSQETVGMAHLEHLCEQRLPLVLFDRSLDADVPSVGISNVALARQATLYLIDGGARRIAFMGGPNQMKQTMERKHGYLEALRARALPIDKDLVKCNYITFNSGLSDALELLSLPEPPDAILATHGLLALSSLQAILYKGLRMPEEVSLIGFMSDWVSEMALPRITFVKQNLRDLGCQAFRLLLEQLEDRQAEHHVVIQARLEVRDSTRKVGE